VDKVPVRPRILQQVGGLVGALAEEALRVDHEPTARAAVQHVAVVEVAVERHDLARRRQQAAGDERAPGQDVVLG
jgi:hypothetical protein